MTILHKILILILFLVICGIGAHMHFKFAQHAKVIDTQGQVLKLLLETPPIKSAVEEELKRRQGALPEASATSTLN